MKIKKNKNIKSSDNLFSNVLINFDKNMNQGFSDKKPEKLDMLELELDYNKDIIIKLKTELNSKKMKFLY